MTYRSLLLHVLLAASATAAMVAMTYATGTRDLLPGSDAEIVLAVAIGFALLLLIVFQPWRTAADGDDVDYRDGAA